MNTTIAARLLPYGVAVVGVVLAIALLGREVAHHIDVMELWIAKMGPWGLIAFVGLFIVVTSLMVPDTLMGIIAGALFGLWWGTAVVLVGGLGGSVIQYALARRLLRRPIERMIASNPTFVGIRKAVGRQEFRLQFLVRLTPVSPVMTSYLLGATGVRFGPFLLACTGLIPSFFMEVYVGYAGKHVAAMAGRSRSAILTHDASVLGGLALCIVVVVIVSRIAARAIREAEA